jgi:hypothetical protein
MVEGQAPAFSILDSGRDRQMIIFLNPRATRKGNQRYPLSILAIAATIEGKEEYAIVDGNIDDDPCKPIEKLMRERPARMLAVTVMPGPQTRSAIPVCKWFKETYPSVPIVWGGYFPSIYSDTALNANYVDFAVRGQGEETFVELLAALDSDRKFAGIRGLSFKDQFGLKVHNAERPRRCRIIVWTRSRICGRPSWDRAPRFTRRASAVLINAVSAVWWIFRDRAKRWNRRSGRLRCWRSCSAITV